MPRCTLRKIQRRGLGLCSRADDEESVEILYGFAIFINNWSVINFMRECCVTVSHDILIIAAAVSNSEFQRNLKENLLTSFGDWQHMQLCIMEISKT